MLGKEFGHIDEAKTYNASCERGEHVLRLQRDFASQLKLYRDSESHPKLRAVFEEAYDDALATLAELRNAVLNPLIAQEKALREKYQHQRQTNLIGK